MPRRERPLEYIQAYRLNPNILRGKYWLERLSGGDIGWVTTTSGLTALPTASASQVDYGFTPGGCFIELFQTTAQSLPPFGHATKGLEISGDEVNNETLELVPGGNKVTNPFAMVVGTDSNFFFRATLEITDASGSDQLVVGWRKQQAYAAPTGFLTATDPAYTDFAAIGFAGTSANPNPIRTITDLNDSATPVVTATGFTVADASIVSLEVRVVGRRAVYLINGTRIGNPVTKNGIGTAITAQSTVSGAVFDFDLTDTLIPFIFVRHDADVCEDLFLREFEVGRLVDVGLDPNEE